MTRLRPSFGFLRALPALALAALLSGCFELPQGALDPAESVQPFQSIELLDADSGVRLSFRALRSGYAYTEIDQSGVRSDQGVVWAWPAGPDVFLVASSEIEAQIGGEGPTLFGVLALSETRAVFFLSCQEELAGSLARRFRAALRDEQFSGRHCAFRSTSDAADFARALAGSLESRAAPDAGVGLEIILLDR